MSRLGTFNSTVSVGMHDASFQYILSYMEKQTLDLITVKDSYMVGEKSLLQFAFELQAELQEFAKGNIRITGTDNGVLILEIENDANPGIFMISREHARTTNKGKENVDLYAVASQHNISSLFNFLDEKYSGNRTATAYWWYFGKHGASYLNLLLNDTNTLHPEFYPWMKDGPEIFFDNYLASSSPLLFLSGPAGTGKTSFLRSSICRKNLYCYIGYDQKLFDNDEMFISFISNDKVNVMIMEDAEHLVLPRSKSGNSMMTRFLNVSDGLLKFPNKKIIFTTNETNFENVDSALVRPGRCHAFVEFRKLNAHESKTVCKVASLKAPPEEKNYSLAELFNPVENPSLRPIERRVGFGT